MTSADVLPFFFLLLSSNSSYSTYAQTQHTNKNQLENRILFLIYFFKDVCDFQLLFERDRIRIL